MMKTLKSQITISLLTSLCLLSASPQGAAKKEKKKIQFPGGCYQQGYEFKHSTLLLHPTSAGNRQSMYFIHNLSMTGPVKLYQMKSGEEPYVINLNSKINANQWGVFATSEEIDKFICTVPDKKHSHGKIINCKDVLDVCEFTNVLFGTNIQGS